MPELDQLLLYLSEVLLPVPLRNVQTINMVRVLCMAGLVEAEIPGTEISCGCQVYRGPAVVRQLTEAGAQAARLLSAKAVCKSVPI